MSGDAIETAVTGFFMAFGGFGFARLGWTALKRRAPTPAPEAGRELAAASPAGGMAMKALWLFCLAFGLFVLGCGLILMLAPFLPETRA
jgi:hypothetical protein